MNRGRDLLRWCYELDHELQHIRSLRRLLIGAAAIMGLFPFVRASGLRLVPSPIVDCGCMVWLAIALVNPCVWVEEIRVALERRRIGRGNACES
jgi:hypothetical protein